MANEIKHLAFGSVASPIPPAAGTYTLTFGGDTTAAIAWDDDAAAVEAELELLGTIGSSNVSVTTDGGSGFLIEFVGALADTDVGALTYSSALKQDAGTVDVVEVQAGNGSQPQIDTVTLSDAPTEGRFTLDAGSGAIGNFALDVSAADLETVIEANVDPYDVTGSDGGPWTLTSEQNEAYTWTGASYGPNPLLKALDIEIATDQEGEGEPVDGSGDVTFATALSGAGGIPVEGSGDVTFAAALSGAGGVPETGTGEVTFATALAGSATATDSGTGDATATSSFDATGTVTDAGTGTFTVTTSFDATGALPFTGTGSVVFATAFAGSLFRQPALPVFKANSIITRVTESASRLLR